MDPSGGGDGTCEETKDGKWKEGTCSERNVTASLENASPRGPLPPLFTKDPSGGRGGDSTSQESKDDANSFEKKVQGPLSAADEGEIPQYPDFFNGFSEIPVAVSQEACLEQVEPPFSLYRFDGFSDLPDASLLKSASSLEVKASVPGNKSERFETYEEVPLVVEEHNPNTKILKRTIGEADESHLDSPKRSRMENLKRTMSVVCGDIQEGDFEISSDQSEFGTFADLLTQLSHEVKAAADKDDNTSTENQKNVLSDTSGDSDDTENQTIVIAASPVERFIFANAFRRLTQNHNKRVASVVQREASVVQREASMDKREATMDKREVSLDKREVSLDKREGSVEKREVLADSKEALLLKAKSDDDFEKPAEESSFAQNIEKGKGLIEKAGSYAMLVDNVMNIPTKSKEMLGSYKENKAMAGEFIKQQNMIIAKKLKSYAGTVTTAGVLSYAREAVIETVKGVLIGEGGEASEGEPDDSASEDVAAKPGDSASEAVAAEPSDSASEAVAEPGGSAK